LQKYGNLSTGKKIGGIVGQV